MTRPRSPIIAYNFIEPLRQKILQHPSAPTVLDYTSTARPWEIPPEADLLMAFFTGWADAPRDKPAGWPFNLRQIQVLSAGVDRFPDWFFDGVPVTCGRGVSSIAIAEFAMTALLAQEKQFAALSMGKITGGSLGGSLMMRGVAGKTVALLGTGAIGAAVARRALAFDMRVLAHNRSGTAPAGLDVTMMADLAAMLAEADHLVIAMPLTRQTRGMVDAALLARARPGLHVINVARGELVSNDALLEALESGRVGFATLDVTDPEPLPQDHPLTQHPRVLITPHISWMSEDNFDRLTDKVMRDLDRFVAGEPPVDLVDRAAGY